MVYHVPFRTHPASLMFLEPLLLGASLPLTMQPKPLLSNKLMAQGVLVTAGERTVGEQTNGSGCAGERTVGEQTNGSGCAGERTVGGASSGSTITVGFKDCRLHSIGEGCAQGPPPLK